MQHTLDILTRLIAFDTTSDRSNLALIHFVRDLLAEHGIQATVLPNAEGDKASLLATIGPPVAGGVVLSGHTDTVPVTGQTWSQDPYQATLKEGRLYGRGSVDMKGFIALCLAMVPQFLASPLKRPIHLAFSYDEESTCMGCLPLIDHMRETLPEVAAVIIGEPTQGRVVSAHKGVHSWRTEVTGVPAHSSRPDLGVSATFYAARIISELERTANELRTNATRGELFEPPYSTLHVSAMQGGNAPNIIAKDARLHWELRNLPSDPPDAVRARFDDFTAQLAREMQQHSADCRIQTLEDYASVPALTPEPDGKAEALAFALTGQSERCGVGFCSEAGWFQDRGFSTVVCGPGSIAQAHKADEYIEMAELERYRDFLARLMQHQCAD